MLLGLSIVGFICCGLAFNSLGQNYQVNQRQELPNKSINIIDISNSTLDSALLGNGFKYMTTSCEYDNWQFTTNDEELFEYSINFNASYYSFDNGFKGRLTYNGTWMYQGSHMDNDYWMCFIKGNDFNREDMYGIGYNDFIRKIHTSVSVTINNNTLQYMRLNASAFYNLNWITNAFNSNDINDFVDGLMDSDIVVFTYDGYTGITGLRQQVQTIIYKPTLSFPIDFFIDLYSSPDATLNYNTAFAFGCDLPFYRWSTDTYVVNNDYEEFGYSSYSDLGAVNYTNDYTYYRSSLFTNVDFYNNYGFGYTNLSVAEREQVIGHNRVHSQVSYDGTYIDGYITNTTITEYSYPNNETDNYKYAQVLYYGYIVNSATYDITNDLINVLDSTYQDGYESGKIDGAIIGYNNGYTRGFADGQATGQNATFMGLFTSVADTPVIIIRSLFDFSLFGQDMLPVILSLLTGIILINVIRKFI